MSDAVVFATREHALATPGKFRQVLAEALDMPVATVTSFDRLLSEAGLREQAGRGRGSIHFRPRDAARLVTAITASAQVKDAVQSVERYEATRLQRTASTPGGYANCGIQEFEELGKEHHFVDALEALIRWVAAGASRAEARSEVRDDSVLIIEVMATTPATIGDIRIAGLGDSVLAARYALPPPGTTAGKGKVRGLAKWEVEIRARAARSDLEQFRRISGQTLFQIGEVLANDN